MIDPLVRHLRVRDDGRGNSREDNATFAEFEAESAIVLLGDPGMGKTTFFREASRGAYFSVRSFLITPGAIPSRTIFLDALDEYRVAISGHDPSAEVAKALCNLQKPKFRLSCRAADWFGSTDQEVLRAASASGRVVVLELCPLSRGEILNAVQGQVLDPSLFLKDAESMGFENLLGNPQTLELMARAWGTGIRPQSKFQVYEMGISELLKEMNPAHVSRGPGSHDPQELSRAAAAAASAMLLSNSVGTSRAQNANGEGYITYGDVPCSDKVILDAVLDRRLFTSPQVDRFEPIHRTVAEFLAAKDLAERIRNGLPVDRVMALICGTDGRPVASLRGLFAWLMCNLGDRAEYLVHRDPYGVAAYGDASVLPPSVQCAIWSGLQRLLDPWFLSSSDDRGTFRDLANPNTAGILRKLLQDSESGAHLKVAVLEAIAKSKTDIELKSLIRSMVLEEGSGTWARTSALRAYARSVHNDWSSLEKLDSELAQSHEDSAAPEIRGEILSLTRTFGAFPKRLISILEQATMSKSQGPTGRFYRLMEMPSSADLDEILDSASAVLKENSDARFEIQNLFDEWLRRRLDDPRPIAPARLLGWLEFVLTKRNVFREKVMISLQDRLKREPSLFEGMFDIYATQDDKHSFRLRVTHYVWKLLPLSVWPFNQSEFLLNKANVCSEPEKAAVLFHMYLTSLASEGPPLALAQAGWEFLERRPDVGALLGDWTRCEIGEWRHEDLKRQRTEEAERLANRRKNIAYLTPRLTAVREGKEEDVLGWAALHYHGWFYEGDPSISARERLVRMTSEEITDDLLEGVMRYCENAAIPTAEAVINSWIENSIPRNHTLLAMSVFLRRLTGNPIPPDALPHCIAAALTASNASDRLPEYDKTLSEFIAQEACEHPDVVGPVLCRLWGTAAKHSRGYLPGFSELSENLRSRELLTSVSASVLRAGTTADPNLLRTLVAVLLAHDRQTGLHICEEWIAREPLSEEVRIILTTALFIIAPSIYADTWKTLVAKPETPAWESIVMFGGNDQYDTSAAFITHEQRVEVVRAIGSRFPHVGYPIGAWSGNSNPWDAADFVSKQIQLLAADTSLITSDYLSSLETDPRLISYRDLIKHQHAQQEKQQRELSFTFAPPLLIGRALRNEAPATPNDLLAFVVDHCDVLSQELARTQRERYRAYWNEKGRSEILSRVVD